MEPVSLDHLPDGERIREEVRAELRKNPLLRAQNILVDTDGLELVLEGDVETPDQKDLAADVANGVFGVTHVRNEIHILKEAP